MHRANDGEIERRIEHREKSRRALYLHQGTDIAASLSPCGIREFISAGFTGKPQHALSRRKVRREHDRNLSVARLFKLFEQFRLPRRNHRRDIDLDGTATGEADSPGVFVADTEF